jgi:hypothetical protein
MGITRRLLKAAVQSVYTKTMDRVGSKVVAGMTDTSSDAPNAYYTPKRNLYASMVEQEEGKKETSKPGAGEPTP